MSLTGVTIIPKFWFGTFLAECPTVQLKVEVWVRVVQHLHLLAVDSEGFQSVPKPQQVLCIIAAKDTHTTQNNMDYSNRKEVKPENTRYIVACLQQHQQTCWTAHSRE